jgi:hypothetical protein
VWLLDVLVWSGCAGPELHLLPVHVQLDILDTGAGQTETVLQAGGAVVSPSLGRCATKGKQKGSAHPKALVT